MSFLSKLDGKLKSFVQHATQPPADDIGPFVGNRIEPLSDEQRQSVNVGSFYSKQPVEDLSDNSLS